MTLCRCEVHPGVDPFCQISTCCPRGKEGRARLAVRTVRVDQEKNRTDFDIAFHSLSNNNQANGAAEESMTSIFLAENTQDDGSVLGEADFCGAAATLFNGESSLCRHASSLSNHNIRRC